MIAGLKHRAQPDPVWQACPLLAQFHEHLQASGLVAWSTANMYTNHLLNVSKTTGLSLDELASCDVDLTVSRGYPNRKWSLLKKHRGSVRRWQAFRAVPA